MDDPNATGLRPELQAQWELFLDWCQSLSTEPVPATADQVQNFLTAFPGARKTQARRVRAIRLHHEHAGVPLEMSAFTPAIQTVWQNDPALIGVGEALSQLPRYGAPRRIRQRDASGLRGRRDGFLIVLTGALGMSREQARQVSAADVRIDSSLDIRIDGTVISVRGESVPRGSSPDRCPACAVTRWLRVVTAVHHGHRDKAMDLVDVTRKDESRHDCVQPFDAVAEWEDVGPLLLSLNQDGWTRPGTPMSVRSITAILRDRRVSTGRREGPAYQRRLLSTRFDIASPDEVYQAAGHLDDQVTQALMRTQMLLDELEAALLRAGGPETGN